MLADLTALPATKSVLERLDLQADAGLVLIQHLRHDTLSFAKLLLDRFAYVRIIAIPYSIDPSAVRSAEVLGFDVAYPTLADIPATLFDRLETSTGDVVVQDVGGHLADLLKRCFPRRLIGVVEETKQGLWRYAALSRVAVPIVQIADSQLKQIEARYVGAAVACSLIEQLRALSVSFIGRRVGVLGYGDIGSATARVLRGLGAIVAVTDSSATKQILAESDGFAVLSLKGLLRSSVALVACTGRRSIGAGTLDHSGASIILASGSSRQIEYEEVLDEFDFAFELPAGMRATRVLRSRRASGALLLNEGFPINFVGESLPGSIIDLVFAQLSVGLVRVGESNMTPGLYGLGGDDLETVAKAWLEAYPYHPDTVDGG